jgi:hypothetical protein
VAQSVGPEFFAVPSTAKKKKKITVWIIVLLVFKFLSSLYSLNINPLLDE